MALINPGKRLCYPDGPPDAKIAFIGEAPGSEEEKVGRGFVGSSGHLLFRLASHAGITRDAVYCTNVVKERPVGNDISKFIEFRSNRALPTAEYTAYENALYDELKAVKANVLVPVGNIALWALCRQTAITKRRGSILSSVEGRKVIPIIHPAAALRQYILQHTIAMDLRRIKTESEFSDIRLPLRQIKLRPSFLDSMQFLDECLESPLVAYDIEVMREQVSCISFANSPYNVISIPFVSNGADYFTPDQEIDIWKKINTILSDPKIKKVGQNICFDSTFLFQRLGILTRNIEDTMIGQAICYPDFPKGLDFITSMHTREPYYKDEGKKWFKLGGSEEDFWLYNAKDSAVCFEALSGIKGNLETLKNIDAYETQCKLVEPLTYMQLRGIKVDVKGMRAEAERAGIEIERLTTKLCELSGYKLNPNSPAQLKDYFYKVKGAQPYYNRKTGAETTDKNALKRLSRKGHEEAKVLLEIRRLSKLKGTYLDVTLDDDNRLRCSFNPVGTESGRLSSSETIFGTGCLPPEAEVLTELGWAPITEVYSGRRIVQWDKTGTLSFVPAIPFKTFYKGKIVVGKSEQFYIKLTPEHRVISKKAGRGTWRENSALEISSMAWSEIPVSGRLRWENIKFSWPRLLTATLADGSYEGNKVRISMKKNRKVERLLELFNLYEVNYTEQACSRKGYRRFAFYRPDDWPPKKWDIWTIMLDEHTAEEMADEIRYWDAHIRGNSSQFFTADEEQAKWVATLAHITDRSATIRAVEQSANSWSNTPMYVVNIKPRQHITIDRHHWSEQYYEGDVFCVTVPSSYFLVRYKGFISVTGNTNMQNLPIEFRKYLMADSDCMIYNMDLSQAENRVVAFIAPEPSMIEAFEKGVDIHRLTAGLIFGKKLDEVSDEVGSCTIGGGEFSERFWGKKANHGLNYDLGYKTFAFLYEIPEAESKFIVEQYHKAYPGVRQYHAWVRNQLAKDKTLENCFGRRRLFLDRWGDELFKSAYSFIPQSTVADKINRHGIMYIYYNQQLFRPVDIILQVHDSIVFQMNYKKYTWEEQAECILLIKQSLESPIQWHNTKFTIPVGLEVGVSMSKKDMVEVKNAECSSVAGLAGRLSSLNEQFRTSLHV